MSHKWIAQVRSAKKLSVFPAASITGSHWSGTFPKAISEFNRISSAMKLGVTMTIGTTAPDTDSLSGANILVNGLDGTIAQRALGQDFADAQLDGAGMSGNTSVFRTQTNGEELIFQAQVYLPLNPTISSGAAGSQVQRPVGEGIKLFVLVHELVHTCGLENAEHSPGGTPDIFVAQPQPQAEADPKKDTLRLRLQPRLVAPPLFLSSRTAKLIQDLWV